MNINRRHLCSALAIGSTGIVGEAVSAQSEIQITGTISSAVEADIGGVELFFQQVDTGSFWEYTVPSSGDIDLTVSETGTFRVRLKNTTARNENVPLIYSFGRITVDSTGASVNYTIPQSYDVKIQCLDDNRNPVERIPILLRAGGYSHGPGLLTTSKQGYVQFVASENLTKKPELQLSGPTTVEVGSTNNAKGKRLDTIDVVEDAEFEFVVSNPEKYQPNYKIIEANPDQGFHLPYLLYTPEVDQKHERPLYVEPLNVPETKDRQELDKQLIDSYKHDFAVARRNKYPGVIPGIPRPPEDGADAIQSLPLPSHQSDLINKGNKLKDIATEAFSVESLTRIDKQLLAMISDARSRLESESYPIADKIHMGGFSSSGFFVSRFAFLYPDKVRTITAGGDGVFPLPKDSHNGISLPYPLGTADYKELTGREFDKESWANIHQYIYVGEEDQPLPDTDLRGYYNTIRYGTKTETVFGMNRVTERIPFVKSQYRVSTNNAEFEIFEGVGHETPKQIEEAVVEFHNQNSPERPVKISNVEIDPNTVSTSQTHVLTFDVANLSADAGKDNFTISLPNSINVDNVTIRDSGGLDPMPDNPAPENPIRFTVNPTSSIQSQIKMTVDLELSSRSD